MTAKCKRIKKINHKAKDIQYKYLHCSDCSLLLNYEQQQIINLCRLTIITVMSHNTSNVDSDILDKWHLYIIKMMLKLRLMNIIDCYDDNMIDKCIQIINLTVKECRDLLLLMHHKMIRNFLLNWVAQLSECLAIIVILILNNIVSTNVVADMFWTVKTTERI